MPGIPPFDSEIRTRLEEVGWLDDPRAVQPMRTLWEGPDPIGAAHRAVDYLGAAAGIDVLGEAKLASRLAHLAGGSRELMRQLITHPGWLVGAEPGDLVGMARSTLAAVAADDLAGLIDVETGGRRLSDMADHIVETILAEDEGDGPPLAIMAMGKWGGAELNYWSDIDLVFVFDGDLSDAPAATRAASRVMRRLGGEGSASVVLNADADLRPEGSRGPLARSLTAYRAHYERWAEPWEFQALLKVRHAAGDSGVARQFLELVAEVLWPETIDSDSIRSLRALKGRVEASADPADLKRAPGGIRDIEFAVQLLQLVHGRFDPELRHTSTLVLLDALAAGGYVADGEAERLARAYRWLRAVEHRVQLWDLRQTHLLPRDDGDRTRLARAMGYRDTAAATARGQFETDVVAHRSAVRRIHEDLYFRPLLEAFAASPTATLSREGAERRLRALGFRDIGAASKTFESLTSGLSRKSRLMQQMLPLVLDWLADSPDPDLGLDQLRLLAANSADHSELITSLHERPVVGQRLALLLGSSKLLGSYLDRLPEFLPRLGDDQAIAELRDEAELERRLRRRVDARPDQEAKVGTLRRFARRRLVRVAARDLLGMAGVDQTMTDLTDGADAAVRVATSIAGGDEGFAVIAMGHWGGRELSYGSDLDLLYVHDGRITSQDANTVAVRLRDLLSRPAADGVAWDIDAGLRPEGRSGPLVRSLESYLAYYQRWAATWELQALVKARPVAGDAGLGERFLQMIEPFVWQDPFPSGAVADIRRMKARVEKERIPSGEDPDFHLKLGAGGLVDVEFLVQLLQLARGGADPTLRTTSTLAGVEALAEVGAIPPDDGQALSEAYRFCSRVRNRLYLQTGRRSDSLPTDPAVEWRLAMSLGYERRGDLREEYRRVTRRSRRVVERLFYDVRPGPGQDLGADRG